VGGVGLHPANYDITMHACNLGIPIVMANNDYTSISEVVTFSVGSQAGAMRCVDIPIEDDDALEGTETFTLTLTTSDPYVMLGNNMTTITIIDNEGK
jgi:hypothetical protein